jgi:hypothetical protein
MVPACPVARGPERAFREGGIVDLGLRCSGGGRVGAGWHLGGRRGRAGHRGGAANGRTPRPGAGSGRESVEFIGTGMERFLGWEPDMASRSPGRGWSCGSVVLLPALTAGHHQHRQQADPEQGPGARLGQSAAGETSTAGADPAGSCPARAVAGAPRRSAAASLPGLAVGVPILPRRAVRPRPGCHPLGCSAGGWISIAWAAGHGRGSGQRQQEASGEPPRRAPRGADLRCDGSRSVLHRTPRSQTQAVDRAGRHPPHRPIPAASDLPKGTLIAFGPAGRGCTIDPGHAVAALHDARAR